MHTQSDSISFAKHWDQNVYMGASFNNSARGIRNTFLLIKTWCAVCFLPTSDSPGQGLSTGRWGRGGSHRLDPLMRSTELGQGAWELNVQVSMHTPLTKHGINHEFSQ